MKAQAPHLAKQFGDIQGMLRSGYGWLKSSRFLLLTIREGQEEAARAWLAKLVESGVIASAHDVGKSRTHPIERAAAIAFSFLGLTKLGCMETKEHPFPTPFRSGMGSDVRALLLRDNPREWRWSDVDGAACGPVHVLIAEWTPKDAGPLISDVDEAVFCVIRVENDPCSFQKINGEKEEKLIEAFGFRDGLAQPVIQRLRQDDGVGLSEARTEAGSLYDDRVVSAGEFILGYRNEYDELTYCPNVEGWTQSGRAIHPGGRFALNGSYLAVRQIEQDVEAFDAFRAANGQGICEKLMGRQANGLPLGWTSNPKKPTSDSKADAFRYRVEDANGFICPKGAHVRRVNPRDTLGVDVQSSIRSTKLHRLLRRGRPYREQSNGKTHKGIFFIACNADIERQFEFVQQRWVRKPGFVNLHADDPLVGSSDPKTFPKALSMPGLPSGEEVSLASFTTTLGGGYFFLPGIAALNFIVGNESASKSPGSEVAEAAAS
ncbi:Dyp-type peroxidase [Bradyrhizobium sp. 139]|uniref:Dyp-type peroxidase n=1 Tax=Bradyrhizobium sp. 139 TaxID=2782616 RepID=UPI001FF83B20|nr:Dyp-type peroxidase domain-containing protein [Bradyrhizobium sp. 139]MCK1742591.1 Dyp-type peroxidase [Bradyrhizobium sp. 139]